MGLISFLSGIMPQFDPAACQLPDVRPQSAPKAAVRQNNGARVVDTQTRTFEWITSARSQTRSDGAKNTLTEYDAGLLQRRNLKNMGLAARLKPLWFDGVTAGDAAKEVSCSLDYAKKIFGTFSAALLNEKGTVQ